jgi:beta-xylosidase
MGSIGTWLFGVMALALAGSAQAQDVAAAAPSFNNPVLARNFPDASILQTEEGWFAYATNDGVNVQVAHSNDLSSWKVIPDSRHPTGRRDAMPSLPRWVVGPDRDPSTPSTDDVWAPEVMKIKGKYVLYFSARHEKALTPPDRESKTPNRRQCIGVATSDRPDRDFVPVEHPLICAEFEEGVIDPHVFAESGMLYLYYKNDGNCCLAAGDAPIATEIFVQELAENGLDLAGPRKSLGLQNDGWEGDVIEAPTMLKHHGEYFLFYSGNWFNQPAYGIGYATCGSPTGPCRDTGDRAFLGSCLTSSPPRRGPGHQAVLEYGGRTFLTFHAWRDEDMGPTGARYLHIHELRWENGRPRQLVCPSRAANGRSSQSFVH